MADLANATERNRRQALHISTLEKRLSEAFGNTVAQDTGLGAPADIDVLQRRITHLEQQVADLQGQITDQADELEAARATNRELMAQLNRRQRAFSRRQPAQSLALPQRPRRAAHPPPSA